MIDRGHIFISYKREEQHFAERLAKSLKREDVDFWMDEDREVGISVGDKWTTEIDQALKNSVGFVLIITPEYFDSDWCKEEMEIAHAKRLPIFPVILRQTDKQKMPEWLTARQSINFEKAQTNEVEYAKQILLLLAGIKKNTLILGGSTTQGDDPFDALDKNLGKALEIHIKEFWEKNTITSIKWITIEQMAMVMGELALKMMNSLDGNGLSLEMAQYLISHYLPRHYKLLPNRKKTIQTFIDHAINIKLIKKDKIKDYYESDKLVDGIRFYYPSYLTYFTAVGLQKYGLDYLLKVDSRYNRFSKRVNYDWEPAVIALCGIVDNTDILLNELLNSDVILSAKCILSNIQVSQDTSSKARTALDNRLFNAVDEHERDFIPEILGLLIQFDGILTLLKILTIWEKLHESHRNRVLDMIVGLGRDAVPGLLSVLKPENTDKPIYVWLIKALGEIGDQRGVQPLQNLLMPIDEENYRVQMAICASLVKLKIEEPIELLRKEALGKSPPYMDKDRDSTRQIRAWYALADIGIGKGFTTMIEVFREVLEPTENSTAWGQGSNIARCFKTTIIQRFGNIAVDKLLSELANPDNSPDLKRTIIETLSEIQDNKTIPSLADALHDQEFLIRSPAIETSPKFEAPETIDTLIGALMDTNRFIRGEAIEALGKLKATKAIPAIKELIEDNELKHAYGERICTIAVSALMAIDTRESLDIAAEWCVKHMNDPRPYHYEYVTVGAWARQRLEIMQPVFTDELIKRFQQGD